MNTLLSILNGALQYNRGRQTGLAGLVGIGLAILTAYQWNHILPILDKLGIVGFFKSHGFVHEGEGGLTGFLIFMFIFKLTILLCAAFLVLIIITLLLTMIFTNETIVLKIMIPIMMVFLFPIIIIYALYQVIFHRKKNQQEADMRKLIGTPQEQLLRDYSEEISKDQALARLNRIPTKGDRLFLLGVSADNKLYILFPRPINFETYIKEGFLGGTVFHTGDLVGLHYSVDKYVEKLHKPKSMFVYVPKLYLLKPVNKKIEVISSEQFVTFYQTNNEDMQHEFKTLGGYPLYAQEIQDDYFTRKEKVLTNMKNATEKRVFDNLVNLMSMFDATNEDIVEMMRASEQQLESKE